MLTQQQIDSYHRDGFIALPDFKSLTAERLRAYQGPMYASFCGRECSYLSTYFKV